MLTLDKDIEIKRAALSEKYDRVSPDVKLIFMQLPDHVHYLSSEMQISTRDFKRLKINKSLKHRIRNREVKT